MKIDTGGGTPIALPYKPIPPASVLGPFPYAIAVDATSVYWTIPNDGTVMKVAK